MKPFLYLLVLLLSWTIGCRQDTSDRMDASNPPSTFKSLSSHFKEPPVEYSTVPFWVWNDRITREKINDQLNDYRNNGIYQVFIHPRPGLITEYLSTEWFELVTYAVEKGKELNMKIWLYDENSFPSGFAGGHVPASLPPGADLVVGLKMHKIKKLEPSHLKDYVVILKKIGDSFANISNGAQNYITDPGDYYTFTKWYYPDHQGLYGGFSYVDLLAYGITERFMRETMKGYEEFIGNEFGKTVPGIFTDEPHIHTTNDPSVIKFTPVLFSRFSETYGYPLENYLPCLYEEIGDWKNVRHDYYALLLDMFIERWAKPWKTYTDSNHLQWTGHYWEHTWPNPEHVADNMALYAWHQVPGIDMLFNDEKRRPDQFGNVRAVKELSSVANQLGKKRTLSETYGGSGWDLDFSDMKRLGDWEYALGVNMMNQHLSYMTIKGARKRDFPLSFSYHSSWWRQYKTLSSYFHRLSYALSSGEQINHILVLEPTTTAWMYYSPDQDKKFRDTMSDIEHSFVNLLNDLEKQQVEYDLGSERILRDEGHVENGMLTLGEREYTVIILPPHFQNVEESSFELLTQYLEQGGKMLSLGEGPAYLNGNISRKVKKTFSGMRENLIYTDVLDESLMQEHLRSDDFLPIEPGSWKGRVFHHQRDLEDGHLLFFSNFDTLETASIKFRYKGESVADLNPLTGEIYSLPVEKQEGYCIFQFDLPPANSKLLFISETKQGFTNKEEPPATAKKAMSTGTTEIRINGPNVLTLDYCNLDVNGRKFSDIYFYQAADTIFKEYLGEIYGFNHNPWSVAVQYRTHILDKNKLLEQTPGYLASFDFFVQNGFIPDQLRAVIENPDLSSIMINDQPVSRIPDQAWLDEEFGVYDLSAHIREGNNRLTIKIRPMNVLAELEPVYLIGNFSLESASKGWQICKPVEAHLGSWRKMGLPFYSESVSYIKKILVDQSSVGQVRLEIPSWKGTVAEVLINGNHSGIIAWSPYQMDISDFLNTGENEIEVKIYGSLKNLLGPHHNHSADGFVTPWSFFYAPQDQPPGDSYDLNDYGLMEDFILKGN